MNASLDAPAYQTKRDVTVDVVVGLTKMNMIWREIGMCSPGCCDLLAKRAASRPRYLYGAGPSRSRQTYSQHPINNFEISPNQLFQHSVILFIFISHHHSLYVPKLSQAFTMKTSFVSLLALAAGAIAGRIGRVGMVYERDSVITITLLTEEIKTYTSAISKTHMSQFLAKT